MVVGLGGLFQQLHIFPGHIERRAQIERPVIFHDIAVAAIDNGRFHRFHQFGRSGKGVRNDVDGFANGKANLVKQRGMGSLISAKMLA